MNEDELVDLVDEDGLVRLPGMRRREVKARKAELLARGLYQPIVVVVVFDREGRVVSQVRGSSKGDDGGGAVDHVCGVIAAGESWEGAARREAAEEIGVELEDLVMVDQRINVYSRHRTLAVARADGEPSVVDSHEVSRVFCSSPDELRAMARSNTSFVEGFFTDLDIAVAHAGD
jgi:8-oxo-dGTP pyrophosphatase MutT (NUDIX family)